MSRVVLWAALDAIIINWVDSEGGAVQYPVLQRCLASAAWVEAAVAALIVELMVATMMATVEAVPAC